MEPARSSRSASCTTIYVQRLKDANALDFDDLLLKTVELFEKSRDGPRALQREVPLRDGRRIPGHEPAAVPADPAARRRSTATSASSAIPDQSIYKWRGADLRNILDFEHDFPEALIVRARAELPLDAGDSRRGVGGHLAEPQPEGEAAVHRAGRRREASCTTAPATTSTRRSSSPGRRARRCTRIRTTPSPFCIAPTRSRERLKTRCAARASPTRSSAASASTSARKSRTRSRTCAWSSIRTTTSACGA